MAVCIAVIAKENYPLYMKSITNDLKYWFTVHTSLDVIEEKIKKTEFKDLYLGLLYLTEDFRVFGYITNTKTKFIIVVETSNNQFHDIQLKSMFKKLHSSFTNLLYNPFYCVGEPIKSKQFDDVVNSLMQTTATNQQQQTQQQPVQYLQPTEYTI